MDHLQRSRPGLGTRLEVTPESADWDYLRFKMVALQAGESSREETGADEVALVPLTGSATAAVAGERFTLLRTDVFEGRTSILYAPPGSEITLSASTDFEYAIGGAPAEGRYPVRLFQPEEMKVEIRGGGPARRQVNHLLAHPLPAERLILFEVYVPGGAWSSWPPHCHDGSHGSSYLEEVYYFRIEPEAGFAFHRNYSRDGSFDELFAVRDGDLVLVTQGFHPVAAAPGSRVYFLNYLAGELQDEGRSTPPVDDPDHAWIKDNWGRGLLRLPVGHDTETG